MDLAALCACLGAAGDLVLAATCAGCALPGERLCRDCRDELIALALPDGPLAPDPVPPRWPGCVGTVRYAGVSARLARSFKDGERRDLAAPLARLLADAVARTVAASPFVSGGGPILLVPTPSAPAAIRRRGDWPMLLLARAAARLLGPGVVALPALRMASGTADQAGLNRAERQANLAGSMRVPRPQAVRGSRCVLVDDVLTSGATLSEGRRALLAAGAGPVGLAVAMVTTRRSATRGLSFAPPAD